MKIHMIHGEIHHNITHLTINSMVLSTIISKSKVLPRTHLKKWKRRLKKMMICDGDELMMMDSKLFFLLLLFTSLFPLLLLSFFFLSTSLSDIQRNEVAQGWQVMDRYMWPPFATRNVWLDRLLVVTNISSGTILVMFVLLELLTHQQCYQNVQINKRSVSININ